MLVGPAESINNLWKNWEGRSKESKSNLQSSPLNLKVDKVDKTQTSNVAIWGSPPKSWVDAPCTFRIWRSIVWKYIAHKDAAWKVCLSIFNQIALQVYCVEVQENPERSTDNVAPTGNLLLRHIWGDWFPINIILLLKEGNLLEISWSLGLLIC